MREPRSLTDWEREARRSLDRSRARRNQPPNPPAARVRIAVFLVVAIALLAGVAAAHFHAFGG